MNVGPVQRLPVESNVADSQRQVRAAPLTASRSGNDPARTSPQVRLDEPLVPSYIQDEVKVQWDGSVHLRIYQFVKPESGTLVLQVPSQEVLNVTRGIQESFQRESLEAQVAQRTSVSPERPGPKE